MILLNKLQMTGSDKGIHFISEIEQFVMNFIMPLVLVAISSALFALYISPTHKKLPDLKAQVTTKTGEITVLQAKVDQLTVLQQNRVLLMDDLVKMSWALGERDKVPELTRQVQVMSEDSKVVFSSLDYANANRTDAGSVRAPSASLSPDPELYREERVNVNITMPDYVSYIDFLKTTENSIRLFRVESIRLIDSGSGKSANLVMASPYLNPAFSTYSETAAPINLTDSAYRQFMNRLDTFKNYAKEVDATLPKL